MGENQITISSQDAKQLWASLAEEGKAPTELKFAGQVIPAYSVAIGPWIDRLTRTYLRGLSRAHAHFKLVIAPYGGGKTHFLISLGSRGLEEGFAVAYIACTGGVSLDSPLDVYRAFVKSVQLPGDSRPGLKSLLRRISENKVKQIEAAGAPEAERAYLAWLGQVRNDDYPENAFGRVMAEALQSVNDSESSIAGEAAIRWLQGDINTLSKEDLIALRLAKVPVRGQADLGRNLLISLLQFAKQEANVNGTLLLFDEVETLFSATGKALQRVLSAMRVMIDLPASVPGGVPLLGVFSAVPDVIEQLSKYVALEQRLAVKGATFEEGSDFAMQIHLDRVGDQADLLMLLGGRLVELGQIAKEVTFDLATQRSNVDTLARVATRRNLQVDARRLFVKTCVNVLELQATQGESILDEDELASRYAGFFNSLRERDEAEPEP